MTIRTTCPYCGVGCGVLATPDGQGGLTVRGDPDHPANRGRLCVKGAALGETVATQGRLLTPRIDGAEAGAGRLYQGALHDRGAPSSMSVETSASPTFSSVIAVPTSSSGLMRNVSAAALIAR